MSNSPSNYAKNLPRVSAIVEYFYPFNWNARQRFYDWLLANDVDVNDYMKEASEGWTYVHKALEDYSNWKEFKWRKYKEMVEAWIQFIKDSKLSTIHTEHYIRTEDYQGTIDLVAEIDWKKWIVDFKTYWLAKYKFWLTIPPYKKPYDKLKKARLQLSLYAHAISIENIWVLELTNDWYHFHELELIPKETIDKMVFEFKYNYIDEI